MTDNSKKQQYKSFEILASNKTWIEGEAIRQLEEVLNLDGITRVLGMPDLHPGKGCPIGAVFQSKGVIYPHLIGNDIGCGMALWRSNLMVRKVKLDKLTKKIGSIEGEWRTAGDRLQWLASHGFPETFESPALGTLGGGNHFAEFQKIEKICDQKAADKLGLDSKHLLLLVHTGSRGLGEAVFREHAARYGGKPLTATTPEFKDYMKKHDQIINWTTANRALVAHRMMSALNTTGHLLFDSIHNVLSQSEETWLHRKGATPTDQGIAIIPGSRGSHSYIVKTANSGEKNLWSIAHGSGRKWKRTECKGRLSHKYKAADLLKTALGSWVICADKELLFEEAPEAYKSVDDVVGVLVDAGIITVIATTVPLLTYKKAKRND